MARYRLTATLGRNTTDRDELLSEGHVLLAWYTRDGKAKLPPELIPDVTVDPVKATLQIVSQADNMPDALNGIILGLAGLNFAFEQTGLGRPGTVLTAEIEQVPEDTGSDVRAQHVEP